MIRLSLYVSKINERLQQKEEESRRKQLQYLIKKRYGKTFSSTSGNAVINLSQYRLSDNENFVLKHGLNYCILSKQCDENSIKSEFEMLFNKLHQNHTACSEDSLSSFKAKLTSSAYEYCELKPTWSPSPFHSEHFRALRSLRSNKDIVIVKADKGGACVILDKHDYVLKMEAILNDNSKFTKLGPAENHDHTVKIEKDFQKFLKDLKDKNLLSKEIVDYIRPVGSRRSRLYGLPKVHKKDVPLRPILSTIGSSQRPVAEYLKGLLQPVYERYSKYCESDSFHFAELIKSVPVSNENQYMCSFDIKNLFTNIPLQEVIDICSAALYEDTNIIPPPFSKSVFTQLLKFATCGLEFCFNDTMYQQKEGLGMGNVLSSLLSNIFVGFMEEKMLADPKPHHPSLYRRYVDDTFALFSSRDESLKFFNELNSMCCLQFTIDEEEDNKLPFLDVLVVRNDKQFITSVYRKPTFSGTYQRWDSFSPRCRKISLLEIIVHRALMICSTSTLNQELDQIRNIFRESGYPHHVIDQTIKKKLARSACSVKYGPKKQPVYIKLPYKGKSSEKAEKYLRSIVQSTFGSATLRVIFSTTRLLPTTYKDTLQKMHEQ